MELDLSHPSIADYGEKHKNAYQNLRLNILIVQLAESWEQK